MLRINAFRACIAAVLCCSPLAVQAAIINMSATLSGGQEVPPTASTGTGSATVVFDDVTNQLNWNIVFSGLTGAATGAHFHGPAPIGTNAGVQVNIGSISGLTSPMIGSTTISAAQETDLLAGLWYINIHTAQFPGGEIRGQVLAAEPVPVPAAVWLFGSGLAGLFAAGRARRG